MKKIAVLSILIGIILLSGCVTIAVKAPAGMFISTGDYSSEVITIGIMQEKKTVLAPLFIYNTNKIHKELYEALIFQAQRLNADGITNIRFYQKLSPFSYLGIPIFTAVFDFYVEGVAIKEK
jgi:hypothetical protein